MWGLALRLSEGLGCDFQMEEREGRTAWETAPAGDLVPCYPPWGEADGPQMRQKVGIHQVTQGQVTSWVMGFWRQQTRMDSRCRRDVIGNHELALLAGRQGKR